MKVKRAENPYRGWKVDPRDGPFDALAQGDVFTWGRGAALAMKINDCQYVMLSDGSIGFWDDESIEENICTLIRGAFVEDGA